MNLNNPETLLFDRRYVNRSYGYRTQKYAK